MKLTAKQEGFAQCVAKGMTQSDAYRENYNAEKMKDETIHERSSFEASKDKVKTRIVELKAKIEAKVIDTFVKSKEKILKELEDLILEAKTDKDRREARECLKEQGKLLGYYVTKVETKDTDAHEDWLDKLEKK